LSGATGALESTIPELLGKEVERGAQRRYLRSLSGELTFGKLIERVHAARSVLEQLGIRRGDRVAVMMSNHVEHIGVIFALITMRAVWVPVNPRLRGRPLGYQIQSADPHACVAEASLAAELSAAAGERPVYTWSSGTRNALDLRRSETLEIGGLRADEVVAIMFTSGTTGLPKGVQVTDRMLRAAAVSAVQVSGVQPGDCCFVWEPMCHIGGAQMLIVPFLLDVSLALVPGFSVSRFWRQAWELQATHIHHLGGILAMLLSQETSPDERCHQVRCSWGGGITPSIWAAAEARFGLKVRECYGLTETSSVVTANPDGPDRGVGRPLPGFEVAVWDSQGRPCVGPATGEIVVRSRRSGLVTPGYFRDPGATHASRSGDWWRTGDLGLLRDGDLHFVGRLGDSIRHRGENVSAWEVESVINTHPAVRESAIIGRPAAHGEQDLAVYVTLADSGVLAPDELIAWCRDRLAPYQVPQHVMVVTKFARTPSLRIDKAVLRRAYAAVAEQG
jgi:crotonobetaine/carnitine-CoA ligase